MMDRKMQREEVDISNLMLLAEVCCQESGKIHLDHQKAIFESFSRKKRSRSMNPIKINLSRRFVEEFQYQETYEQKIVAAPKKPTSKKNNDNKRKQVDDVPNNSNSNSNSDKKKKVKVEKPTSIPAWVEQLARTHLQNSQPVVWVCDKILTASDAREDLNRFFIPRENSTDYLLPALTTQEQGMLRQGISVKGLDGRGELWNLQLKYWSSVNMYVFQKEWFKLLKMNEFKPEQDTIQIWLCRHRFEHGEQERLCFLIGKKGE